MDVALGRSRARLLSILLMASVLSACITLRDTRVPTPLRTPNSSPAAPAPTRAPSLPLGTISEQAATTIALQIAADRQHYMSGANETPHTIRAELATLTTAREHLLAAGWPQNATDSGDTVVWTITMEGMWVLDSGPPEPENVPATRTPQIFHQYLVILDARTGKQIQVSARV
jgi:hypothetical protein